MALDLTDKQCAYIDPDTGEQCRAFHVSTGIYCFNHAPELAKFMQESRVKGGKRQYQLDISDVDLDTIEDLPTLRKFMGQLIIQARKGKIPPQLLTALASSCSAYARVLEMSDLEDRLEKLEEKVMRR